jgi:hypothetical protein
MSAQSKPVAPTPATNQRVKRSIVQPLRVTVYYLNFPAIKRSVATAPPWMKNSL